MKVFVSETARKKFTGAPPFNSKKYLKWFPKGFWYKNKQVLDLDRGLSKLEPMEAALYNRPLVFDIEREPISDLCEVAEAVRQRFPYFFFGFFVTTSPRPRPTSDLWKPLASLTDFTVSQGFMNRQTLEQWISSVELQLARWSVHFPNHPHLIAMRMTPHPRSLKNGWWTDPLPVLTWMKMWRAIEDLYDMAVIMSKHPWDRNSIMIQVPSVIDTELKWHE